MPMPEEITLSRPGEDGPYLDDPTSTLALMYGVPDSTPTQQTDSLPDDPQVQIWLDGDPFAVDWAFEED